MNLNQVKLNEVFESAKKSKEVQELVAKYGLDTEFLSRVYVSVGKRGVDFADAQASYFTGQNRIAFDEDFVETSNPQDIYSVLYHELVHAVRDMGGFDHDSGESFDRPLQDPSEVAAVAEDVNLRRDRGLSEPEVKDYLKKRYVGSEDVSPEEVERVRLESLSARLKMAASPTVTPAVLEDAGVDDHINVNPEVRPMPEDSRDMSEVQLGKSSPNRVSSRLSDPTVLSSPLIVAYGYLKESTAEAQLLARENAHEFLVRLSFAFNEIYPHVYKHDRLTIREIRDVIAAAKDAVVESEQQFETNMELVRQVVLQTIKTHPYLNAHLGFLADQLIPLGPFEKRAITVTAASEEENQKIALDVFQKRATKRTEAGETVVYDPDIVLIDVKRWQYQKRRGSQDVKPSITDYATHEDLHAAMEHFPSKEEQASVGREEEDKGKELWMEEAPYKVYKATTPAAVASLAQGSKWCIQNQQTAKGYLDRSKGLITIITRDDTPIFALVDNGVWFRSDVDIRSGTSYAKAPPHIPEEDITFVNRVLPLLGMEPVEDPKCTTYPLSEKDKMFQKLKEDFFKSNNLSKFMQAAQDIMLKGYRDKEVEEHIIAGRTSPAQIYDYIENVIHGRWPEAEAVIAQDPSVGFRYVINFVKKRVPAMEAGILKDPYNALQYAIKCVKGRWPEAEASIGSRNDLALTYAKDVVKGRFPAGERTILKSPDGALEYAKEVIKGRFPEAEVELAKFTNFARDYAIFCVKGPWPEGEKSISKGAYSSLAYAKNVIKGRFPAGEAMMKVIPSVYGEYAAEVVGGEEGKKLLDAAGLTYRPKKKKFSGDAEASLSALSKISDLDDQLYFTTQDVAYDDLESLNERMIEAENKYHLTVEQVTSSGPGAGWPEYKFTGAKADLVRFLQHKFDMLWDEAEEMLEPVNSIEPRAALPDSRELATSDELSTTEQTLTPEEMTPTNTEMFTRMQNPDYALSHLPGLYQQNPNQKAPDRDTDLRKLLRNLDPELFEEDKEASLTTADDHYKGYGMEEDPQAIMHSPTKFKAYCDMIGGDAGKRMYSDYMDRRNAETADYNDLNEDAKLQYAVELAQGNIVYGRNYESFIKYVKENGIDPLAILAVLDSKQNSIYTWQMCLAFIYDFKLQDKVDPSKYVIAMYDWCDKSMDGWRRDPDNTRGGYMPHSDMSPADWAKYFKVKVPAKKEAGVKELALGIGLALAPTVADPAPEPPAPHVKIVKKPYVCPDKGITWTCEEPRIVKKEVTGTLDLTASVPGSKDFKYSSVQVAVPDPLKSEILKWSEDNIPDASCYTDEDAHGREDYPHITVMYGLHEPGPEGSITLLDSTKPFEVKLGNISLFSNKDKPYDVVKVEVESPELHKLNYTIGANLEVTNDFPEYKPHMTLAYVKKGEGVKWDGSKDLASKKFTVRALEFSSKSKEIGPTSIPLVASLSSFAGCLDEMLDSNINYHSDDANNPEQASDKYPYGSRALRPRDGSGGLADILKSLTTEEEEKELEPKEKPDPNTRMMA